MRNNLKPIHWVYIYEQLSSSLIFKLSTELDSRTSLVDRVINGFVESQMTQIAEFSR